MKVDPSNIKDRVSLLNKLLKNDVTIPKEEYSTQLPNSDVWLRLQEKLSNQSFLWKNEIIPVFFSISEDMDSKKLEIKNGKNELKDKEEAI